jgi:peptide/nickel transport system permease protein
MTPLISEDARKVYTRRIKGFWEEFSHNRIGFVGLALLCVYVGMAVFSPYLTPYDPMSSTRIAESFAVPAWLTSLPQYREYPFTMEIRPYWGVTKGRSPPEVKIADGTSIDAVIDIPALDARPLLIEANATFTYPYGVPPMRFVSSFAWVAQNLSNVQWSAQLELTNVQSGSKSFIWLEPYQDLNINLGVESDSNDYWLLKKLGYTEVGATNLAHILFNGTVKGDYRLTFRIAIRPINENARMQARISMENFKFFIPGLAHGILGADYLGTDVLSQLIYGSRISLAIGLMAAAVSVSIGVIVGTVSGYLGGAVDEITMRIVDVLLCLPTLPLLLTLVRLFGKNVFYIVLFIAIFGWVGLARVIRSQILYLRETAFVECALASGASKPYIMIKHLMPNIFPVALSSLVLSVPAGVLSEAALSFLGFGDPRVPTWGKMLNYAFGHGAFENGAWWWVLPPGLAITFLSLTFVFMGFAIDEIVNPRLRRRR